MPLFWHITILVGGAGYSRLSGGFTGIIPGSRENGCPDYRFFAVCILWRRPQRIISYRTKRSVIPASGAGCSLAESNYRYELREWKKANPDGIYCKLRQHDSRSDRPGRIFAALRPMP